MLELFKLNLQLFADGGDGGGDGGSASGTVGEAVGSDTSGDKQTPAFIPEKAKKYYQKAMERTANKTPVSETTPDDAAQTTNAPTTTEKLSYTDLIKSDEYKDDHKAYMDKAISDRLKKYKGIEEDLGKYKGILETVGTKYGVNPSDENFLQVLSEKIEADDSYYEDYAMEHNISTEEARKVVTMERKAKQFDELQAEQIRQEQARQQIITLRQNAEKTKALFPDFDLDTQMQDERFRRICAASNGDTTAAYYACHHDKIRSATAQVMSATAQVASQQARVQTANAIAANKSRPIENGISSTAPSVVTQDFRNMNLQQLRKIAEEQRRQGAKR